MRWDRKSVLSVKQAEYAFEISRKEENRKNLYRVSAQVNLPEGVFPVALFGTGSRPLIYGSDGALYRKENLSAIKLDERFSRCPFGTAVTIGGAPAYVLSDGDRTAVVGAACESELPGANALASDGERIFLAAQNAVRYTDALPAPPYAVAGEIRLPMESGAIRDLTAFGGSVYCFCDDGVYRLSARGAETAFSLERVHALSERAERRSPVVYGGKIYYLSGGDLFAFDGARAKRVDLPPFVPDGALVPAGRRLLIKGNAADSPCVLAYDAAEERSDFVRGTYGVVSSAFGGSLFLSHSCRYDMLTESPAFPARPAAGEGDGWESGSVDFGKRGIKLLTELRVAADRALVLTVASECETARFTLAEGESAVFPALRGERFCFSAKPDALRRLEIIYRMS